MRRLSRSHRIDGALIALLAALSSAAGIANGFAYDDRSVVELNPVVRGTRVRDWYRVFAEPYWPKGWGGDGYRPVTMLAFKLEYAIGHGRPVVFHVVNVLLYVAVGLLVLALARRLLPERCAWVVVALFAVHPVHVEAVANVVGQSELLVAVAVLAALLLYLRDRSRDGGWGRLEPSTCVAIVVLYAIACFTKEHGIVLPAILLAAELTVLDQPRLLGARLRPSRPFYLALAAVAVAFLGAHAVVESNGTIGGFVPFIPFNTLHTSPGDRILTAVGVVPQWIRLLYWPAKLSAEYGPPDIEIMQGMSITQLPGALLLAAILTLGVTLRRREPVISFGIAFVCIALLPTSNLVLPAGIVLAERTLFLPSVGAMLIVGGVAVVAARWAKDRAMDVWSLAFGAEAVCAALVVVGTARSSERSRIWRDNETLFHQTVLDAPFAYRAHYMLGAWDFEHNRKREGEAEYRQALKLFPYDPYVALNLAEQYRSMGLCEPAIPLYAWTRAIEPGFRYGHANDAFCLLEVRRYDDAKAEALTILHLGGAVGQAHRIIFLADSAKAADVDTLRRSRRAAVARAGGAGRGGRRGVAGELPDSVPKTAQYEGGRPRNSLFPGK